MSQTNIDLEGWDLHRAAKENRIDIAGALIDSGADIEAMNEAYETPLHTAASHDSLDVARLLIDHSANTTHISKTAVLKTRVFD